MKNQLWSVAVGFCLAASSLQGEHVVSTYLPVAHDLLEWMVTNSPCSVMITLQSTNETGGLNTTGMSGNDMSFRSFKDFQSYVAANGSRLFGYLGKLNGSMARFRVSTTYKGFGGKTCTGLSIDVILGLKADVVMNSFYVTPKTPSLAVFISGVATASVQFGSGTPASMLIIGTNRVVWDSLFDATNYGRRARVSLTFDDGETVIYTQGGNLILEPTISMAWSSPDSSYNLLVSGSSGADTMVESTTNFISWTAVGGGMPWDAFKTNIVIPIPMQQHLQFFRVRSY